MNGLEGFEALQPASGHQDERPWNPLKGIFASWVGLAWLALRMMLIMVPLALLVLLPSVLAHGVWGEMGFGVAVLIMGLVVLPFWTIPTIFFFFPAYFDLVRLSGFFLQKTGRLQPRDTLGAVNRRWDQLHAGGARWWRCWRARS